VILVDTSAWVEYDRATGSSADRRIAELITADGPLMFTEPVLMEVLAGARDDAREDDLRRMLLRFDLAQASGCVQFLR
jgi:predicted nucleic acid-binding protein